MIALPETSRGQQAPEPFDGPTASAMAVLARKRRTYVMQEAWMDREQWFVLNARRPGVSARGLAKQYGMEELRDYFDRSREIDKRRELRVKRAE